MDDALGIIFALVAVGFTVAGWLTHVVTTVQDESWVLLILGAMLFPIGVLHGWGIMLGIF